MGSVALKRDDSVTADLLFEALADGASVATARAALGIGSGRAWELLNADPVRHAHAREARGLHWATEIEATADRMQQIVQDVASGALAPDAARAMIDGLNKSAGVRQWLAARYDSKRWGDKQTVENVHTGERPSMTLLVAQLAELERSTGLMRSLGITIDVDSRKVVGTQDQPALQAPDQDDIPGQPPTG